MRTLGLIPARMGSKRIPDKNLQLVNGRPLVERAIICAGAATSLDIIVVSSDDERVKLIADAHDVQFLMRPDELAQDDTLMVEVVRHAIDNYEGYDAVCILEPPATFRRGEHIDKAVQLLATHPGATGVRTVTPLKRPQFAHFTTSAGYMVPLDPSEYYVDHGFARWPLYRDNGVANVVRTEAIIATDRLFDLHILPLIIADEARGLDIDVPEDLVAARMMAYDLDRG